MCRPVPKDPAHVESTDGFARNGHKAGAQGPWGGPGGQPFYDGRGDVVEIEVIYDDNNVTNLHVTYAESTGVRWEVPIRGPIHGPRGDKFQKIKLDYPDEYLRQVRGTTAKFLNSISFVTSKKTYGPFGNPRGTRFQSRADGVVVGFFGRWGRIIYELGVLTTADSAQLEKPARGAVVAQGQWGGPGGGTFCDGRGDIVEVTVKYNEDCLTMLQAAYEHSGVRFQGIPHGCGRDGKEYKVALKFPDERLMQVKGTYNPSSFVTSITLITNKRTCGPFGYPRGQHFQSLPNGVVGFYGRSDITIDQLGVLTHVESPWRSNSDTMVSGCILKDSFSM